MSSITKNNKNSITPNSNSNTENETETETNTNNDATIQALNSLLNLINNPQDLLHTILLPPSTHNKKHKDQVHLLKCISKELFGRVEQIASLQDQLGTRSGVSEGDGDGDDEEEGESFPLSGLPELYTGTKTTETKEDDNTVNEDDMDTEYEVDSETIFNQVDIQNDALLKKMNKSVRKLTKKIDREGKDVVRLLTMDDMEEEEKETGSDDSSNSDDDDDESGNESKENDDDDDSEDEETRRIRERMERSMVDMDGFSDDDEEDENESDDDDEETKIKKSNQNDSKTKKEEEGIDPSREDLYDGFFDLHEMEDFADEEEEMLPDEAWTEPIPDAADAEELLAERKKSLPHVMAREGKEDNDDEEDGEFDALEKQVKNLNSVRRKRYRDDEDINALANMYGDMNGGEDVDEEEEDEVINITAADFFGPPRKPSKAFMKKSQAQKEKKDAFDDNNGGGDDDDSWNDHDFAAEETKNWRDQEPKNDDDGDDNENDSDDDDSDDGDKSEKMNDQSSSEDETNNNNNNTNKTEKPKELSNYAKRSTKLEEMTKNLEKEILAEKPWQMVGEAKGTQRPTNSLLEATPTFEFATKMAPLITAEHTESIEEMIQKRILAEDWDDVVPRELPDIGLNKRKGELPEVSQEKSKLSLGELYEREYLKKTTGYDADKVEKETEEEKVKNEMRMLFANVCSKLDALSNYHFAPRPVADEAEAKTSATPAVAMEEVLPLHVSDAHAMAPEEIFNKKKGKDSILRGESELEQVSIILSSSLNFAHIYICINLIFKLIFTHTSLSNYQSSFLISILHPPNPIV
jgi:U3 small nucleolar RNA-associated protein MPP10